MPRFIPSFILHQTENNALEGNFNGYVVQFDIVDFTRSCSKLFHMEKGGVEILSRYLDAAFYKPIKYLVYYGGFVSSFSGDACTVIMPQSDVTQVFCAVGKIVEHFSDFSSFEELELKIRLSVSYGNVHWQIFSNPYQYEYVFTGEAFDDNIKLQQMHKELLFSKKAANHMGMDQFDPCEDEFVPKIEVFSKTEAEELTLHYPFDITTRKLFCHKCMHDIKLTDENRQAGYCYISLKDIELGNLPQTISLIEELAAEYYGLVNKIEKSDKGFMAIVIFGIPLNKGDFFNNMCRFSLKIINKEPKLRMGLSIGYVLACHVGSGLTKEYTAFGYPMNLAARLMSEARTGEVITDTYLRDQLDTMFYFHKLKTIKPKGFDKEITCYRLSREVQHDDMYRKQEQFVGRQVEMDDIHSFILDGITEKDNRIVYVHGDPGIGKSKLTEMSIAKLDSDTFSCYTVKCSETEMNELEGIKQLLSEMTNYNRWAPPDEARAMFHGLWESWARNDEEMKMIESIIGSLWGYEWPDSKWSKISETDKSSRLREAVIYMMNYLSKIKPILVRLEDVQWLDKESKKYLNALASKGGGNIIILCSCRYLHGHKVDLNLPGFKKMDVELLRLSIMETGAMIRCLVNPERQIPQATVEFIDSLAEGVPLFVEQLTLDMREHDRFSPDGNLTSTEGYSRNLKINNVINSRIDNLSESVKNALFNAAILGNQFYVEVLSKMLETKLEAELEQGVQDRIWVRYRHKDKRDAISDIEELQFIFSHIMIHTAAYDRMMDTKRNSLHFAAALAMDRLYKTEIGKHAEDIGMHYEKARLLDPAAAMYNKAGEYYKGKRNYTAAARCYKKALSAREKQEKEEKGLGSRPDIVPTINNWVEQILNEGSSTNIAEASSMLKKALTINEDCMDLVMSDKAKSLSLQSKLFKDKSMYQEAVEQMEQALNIRKKHMKGNDPILGATYNELGNLYFQKGEDPKAESAFKHAIRIWEKCGKSHSPEMADSLNDLARLYGERDKKSMAEELFKKALVMRRDTLGNDHVDLTETLNDFADFLTREDRFAEAESLLKEALAIRTAVLGPNSTQVAETYHSMGDRYMEMNDFENAELYFEKALKIREQYSASNQYELAELYQSWGDLCIDMSRFDTALKYLEKAFEIRTDILDEGHDEIAETLNSLGNTYNALNRNEEAEECFRRSGEILEKYYKDHIHSDIVEHYKDHAKSLIEKNHFKQAEKLLQKALKMNLQLDGEDSLDTAEILDDLGRLNTTLAHYAEAESQLSRALEIRRDKSGDDSIDAAESYIHLGILFREMQDKERYPKAEQLLARSLVIRVEKYPNLFQDEIAESMIELAKLLVEMEEFSKAAYYAKRAMVIYKHTHNTVESPEFADGLDVMASLMQNKDLLDESTILSQKAMEIRAKLQGTDHPDYADTISILATTYTELDEHDKAEELLQKVLQIRTNALGEDHPDVGETMNDLGESLREQDKYDESKNMFTRAMKLLKGANSQENLEGAESLHEFGLLKLDTGDYEEALKYMKEALNIRRTIYGRDHSDVAESLNDIGLVYTRMGLFVKALNLYNDALDIRKKELDPRHTEVADTLKDMGNLYWKSNNLPMAVECFEKALDIYLEKRGVTGKDTIETMRSLEMLRAELSKETS